MKPLHKTQSMARTPFTTSLSKKKPPIQKSFVITNLVLADKDWTAQLSPPETLKPAYENLDTLVIERGKISKVCNFDIAKQEFPELPRVDGQGYLAFPGLANAHTHCAMGFFRGMGHGIEQMIQKLFFPVESALTRDLIESLALGYILSGLKRGVTFFADHYYFVDGVGKALDRLGLRGALGETIADLGGAHPSYESFVRAKKHLDAWPHSSRITPVIAPHATDTVSLKLLKECSAWAKSQNLPIHMHLAQTQTEWDMAQSQNKTPVNIAEEAGLLTDRSLLVHMLHVTPQDLARVKKSGATIGVCPASQILYEKLVDLKELLPLEIPLAIATDCAASNDHCDILLEMRLFGLLAKDRQCPPASFAPQKLWQMATEVPFRLFTPHQKIGALKADYHADIVFASLDESLMPLHAPLTNLIYSAASKNVKHVLVDGSWVLWNEEPTLIDQKSLIEEYQAASMKIQQQALQVVSEQKST